MAGCQRMGFPEAERYTRKKMSRIHVCHIIEGASGGTATHLLHAVKFISSEKIKFSFIVSPLRSSSFLQKISEICPESQIIEIPMKRPISPVADIVALFKIFFELRKIKPEFVHTHCSKAGVLGRIAAFFCRIKVIHTPHVFSLEWAGDGILYLIYATIEKLMSKITDKLIVLNESQADIAREEIGFAKDKIKFIANGVDLKEFFPVDENWKKEAREIFKINEKSLVVGMAARMEKQKGWFDFLKSLRLVVKDYPRLKMLLAGNGSLLEKLKKKTVKYGLKDNVVFLGEVGDMLKFYHALDVFVLSSYWEGMPYAILEAQACGIPVVAGSCAGTVSIITPGKTGTLVRPENINSMAGAICSLLRDKDLRLHISEKSAEQACAEYSVERWAKELTLLYASP